MNKVSLELRVYELANFVTQKKDLAIFAGFFLLVSFLRLSSFFRSVIDWDESIYLLVVREILDGQILYTGIWDHKPPGIYVIFAVFQILLGESIFAIRMATCIAVTVTCYVLYRLGTIIGNTDPKFGLLAGIFYAVYSLNLDGLAANTEIFFTPFVASAFYLLFSCKAFPTKLISSNSLSIFLIGLLLGIGLQINYLVLFAFVAVLLIAGSALFFQNRSNQKHLWKQILLTYILLGLGFILPFLFIILYFTLNEHLNDYIYANFLANMAYTGAGQIPLPQLVIRLVDQFGAYFFLWICVFLLPLYLFFFRNVDREEKKHIAYLLVWLLMGLVGVSFTGRFYNHYFLQVLPPLSLIGAYVVLSIVIRRGMDRKRQYFVLILILITPLLVNIYSPLKASGRSIYNRYVKGVEHAGDNPAVIAHYLQERVDSEDYIYIVDYQFIIYYLVSAKIPTKYALTPLLSNEALSVMIKSDPVQELRAIMSKKPIYIVKTPAQKGSPYYIQLNSYLQNDYFLEKHFPNIDSLGDVEVYKLKN